MKIFDEEVVNRTVGGRILRASSIFREWMAAERQRLENPAVYEELDQLVSRLRERRLGAIKSTLITQPAELRTN